MGAWQIRLLYCSRSVLSDVNADLVTYNRISLTKNLADHSVASVHTDVLHHMKQVEQNDPRMKNFAALNHLFRVTRDQMEKQKNGKPPSMGALGICVATVGYLLGLLDTDFLEHFLQDYRNAPLIQQLQRWEESVGFKCGGVSWRGYDVENNVLPMLRRILHQCYSSNRNFY